MKIRSLDTIAALREMVEEFRSNIPGVIATSRTMKDKALQNVLMEEAAKFETIANELGEVANEIANARAFATARFLLGPLAKEETVEEKVVFESLRGAIRTSPALLEFTAPLSDGSDTTCIVRLVPFYDPTLDEERWAVHYFNTDGDEGMGDNAAQEDAEFRYWQIAEPLGQVRSE